MEPGAGATPRQLSLFPDGYEIQAQAYTALAELELPRARRLLDRARQQNPRLPNLTLLDEGLRLLEAGVDSVPPDPEQLAGVLLEVRRRVLAGSLRPEAGRFVDEVVARFWRRRGTGARFLDRAERAHRGMLDLIAGDAALAHHHLRASLEAHGDRADLWAYFGDACLARDRDPEANAAYVRALVLDADAVDLVRLRFEPLRRLHDELRCSLDDASAHQALLVRAWARNVLHIPPENDWLDGRTAGLLARVSAGIAAPRASRCRRFALLLYLDRSSPMGTVDLARREEMAELEPELFAEFMAACRQREEGG